MSRKTHRDDKVRNALVNLLEDLDAAQMHLDAGDGDTAKEEVRAACFRFSAIATKGSSSNLRDLIVSIEIGRIKVAVDYADDLGELSATYLAARR